jgi:septal ring factor EnvC (AmiA/AmiB activator)
LALVALVAEGFAESPTGATVSSTDPAREAAARQKLEAVRAEMHALVVAERATREQRGSAVAALRQADEAVAAAAKELRALDARLRAEQSKLDGLTSERNALEAKLASERAALAALLRAAYALGPPQELRLLLGQDRRDTVGRLLIDYRYFERAWRNEINALLRNRAALAELGAAIESQTTALAATRQARVTELDALGRERRARQQALDRLDAELADQRNRLAALGKDEHSLLQLLARLRDVFADIPKQLAGAEPFAHLRGRLRWPLAGRIVNDGGTSSQEHAGIRIAAKEGSEVRAVSHGRVVFADWLRGYGLLLILDHGDGYLSLYGNNESLLKDVGDWVDAGEPIATSGASGGQRSAGLYFELRHQGKPVDVRAWLAPASHRRDRSGL